MMKTIFTGHGRSEFELDRRDYLLERARRHKSDKVDPLLAGLQNARREHFLKTLA